MLYDNVIAILKSLEDPSLFGPQIGPKYALRLKMLFDEMNNRQAIDQAVSLGNYLVHSEANKRHRAALRAVLLGEFVAKRQPVVIRDTLLKKYQKLTTDQLKQCFPQLLPAFADNGKRLAWAPENFSNPATLRDFFEAKDWSKSTVPSYMFFVHTVRHPSVWIDNPIITMRDWTAISMSVLSSQKPRAYTNHGLILGVPVNNILSASPSDQWFDNYAGTDKSVKATPGHSMAQHIIEKNLMIGGLLTPQQIVRMQGGAEARDHSAGTSLTEHNEIVVTGLAGQPLPFGTTGSLTLKAYFIQTKIDGSFPSTFYRSQGKPTEIETVLKKHAKHFNVPLLYLPAPNEYFQANGLPPV